jgi:hypothetical protein
MRVIYNITPAKQKMVSGWGIKYAGKPDHISALSDSMKVRLKVRALDAFLTVSSYFNSNKD